jgi:nitroimidazol reductase NimA-like FMN-containing flavoprotein (pyridoxamine 5'-phosphate oxidase superfamily)
MSLAMTRQEREAFLAADRVAVISIERPGRGPLAVPVWYTYTPGGEVLIWAGADSLKVRLIRKAGRFTLCVQQEEQPYKYVTVEGPVVAIDPIDFERQLKPLVYRYEGRPAGDRYIDELGGKDGVAQDVILRMAPEHWLSEDHSKD